VAVHRQRRLVPDALVKAIRFSGGPADQHVAALRELPQRFTFPIIPPPHQAHRRLVAVYRLDTIKGVTVYRYQGSEEA